MELIPPPSDERIMADRCIGAVVNALMPDHAYVVLTVDKQGLLSVSSNLPVITELQDILGKAMELAEQMRAREAGQPPPSAH